MSKEREALMMMGYTYASNRNVKMTFGQMTA
jgi:hypothetical protein